MDPEVGTENGDEMETSGKGEAPDTEANRYPCSSDYARGSQTAPSTSWR